MTQTERARIQAVLVLYKTSLDESVTYNTLAAAGALQSEVFDLMVCDNTPDRTPGVPPGFKGDYLSQPDNPGLAESYNRALEHAIKSGATWLLVLDQDTALTPAYLSELAQTAQHFANDTDVIAVVPKLVENGIVQSPHTDLMTERPEPLPLDFHGFPKQKLHIYNSGALLRVEALRSIGGFPTDFWLDFLDHATFHLLRKEGGKEWVMNATLQHALSTNAVPDAKDQAYLARHNNILAAEFHYYKKYGTPCERWWYRRRLVHTGLRAILRHRLYRIGWRTLMVALRVRGAHRDIDRT